MDAGFWALDCVAGSVLLSLVRGGEGKGERDKEKAGGARSRSTHALFSLALSVWAAVQYRWF